MSRFFHSLRCVLTAIRSRSASLAMPAVASLATGTAFYAAYVTESSPTRVLPVVLAKEREGQAGAQLTYRQKRFLRYSSIEVDGVAYMTPRDFLESVIELEPRPRIGRLQLSAAERDAILQNTVPMGRGSPQMFRSMNDKGLVSYTEYLFLLSVLTKPDHGFRVAFNMFDADGNERVDRGEFQVMERSVNLSLARKVASAKEVAGEDDEESQSSKKEPSNIGNINEISNTETTILRHFFGKKGNTDLSFEQFRKFMDDLQTEVLQLEFAEYSKGMPLISELEFARMLLRYTYITPEHYDEYIARLKKALPEEKGIGFKEFKEFFTLLNNIEDFSIALNMHVISGKPISRMEFQRAVRVSMRYELHPRVLAVVFALFDRNSDNHLSYQEFLAIMKDRLHRGFRSHLLQGQGNWDAFKTCMRHEMKVAT